MKHYMETGRVFNFVCTWNCVSIQTEVKSREQRCQNT